MKQTFSAQWPFKSLGAYDVDAQVKDYGEESTRLEDQERAPNAVESGGGQEQGSSGGKVGRGGSRT